MKPAAFVYTRAASATEAARLLAAGDARVLAGGQSLGPAMNLRLARPGHLVDIARATDLRVLEKSATTLVIGAGWTHAEIEDGIVEDPARGLLRHVAGGIAHRAVRNRGTLGGSLAHADPAADWVSTMMALDAVIVARRPDGTTIRYPADSFWQGAFATRLADDAVLIAVEIPLLSVAARWGYHKICRKTGAFASAIGIAIDDPAREFRRVVVGAVDGPPVLLSRTAASGITTIESELADALPDFDPVRRGLHAVAVRRALEMLQAA